MHIDLECEQPGVRTSAICIVGGGIAGLVMARRLAERGVAVAVLEAGGLEFEQRSQSLYAADMADAYHAGSIEGRFRALGGSSIRWGGQLLPFTPDIFAAWPIDEAVIRSYYAEIEQLLAVGALPFDDELLPALGHEKVSLPPDVRLRYSKWMPFAKRNLARTIGRECIAHPSILIYTHANVASLQGEGGRITTARVLDYSGREFSFQAAEFVVCCGTVETSRLLLASACVPNTHDQIGRYFHDHLSFSAADIPVAARAEIFRRLGPFFVDGVLHTFKLEATPELQRRLGLLAVMAHVVIEEPAGSGVAAVRNLLGAVQKGQLLAALTQSLLPLLAGLGDVFRLLWASKIQRRRSAGKGAKVRLHIDMEQAASADNRIRLSGAVDTLGLAKVVVDWRIGDPEYATGAAFAQVTERAWKAAGLPALDWTRGLLDSTVRPVMKDSYHPMGGLRMGDDAATSVVDGDLRVHGMTNLHVASCAVFPSGGSSNPTFTLIALAMRLADRLASRGRD